MELSSAVDATTVVTGPVRRRDVEPLYYLGASSKSKLVLNEKALQEIREGGFPISKRESRYVTVYKSVHIPTTCDFQALQCSQVQDFDHCPIKCHIVVILKNRRDLAHITSNQVVLLVDNPKPLLLPPGRSI